MAQERRGRSLCTVYSIASFVHYVIRAALRRRYRKGPSAWLYLSEKSKFVQNCRKLKQMAFFKKKREGRQAYTQFRECNCVIVPHLTHICVLGPNELR